MVLKCKSGKPYTRYVPRSTILEIHLVRKHRPRSSRLTVDHAHGEGGTEGAADRVSRSGHAEVAPTWRLRGCHAGRREVEEGAGRNGRRTVAANGGANHDDTGESEHTGWLHEMRGDEPTARIRRRGLDGGGLRRRQPAAREGGNSDGATGDRFGRARASMRLRESVPCAGLEGNALREAGDERLARGVARPGCDDGDDGGGGVERSGDTGGRRGQARQMLTAAVTGRLPWVRFDGEAEGRRDGGGLDQCAVEVRSTSYVRMDDYRWIKIDGAKQRERRRRLVEELPGDLSEKIVEEARRRFVSGLEFTTFGVKEELPRVIEAWVVLSVGRLPPCPPLDEGGVRWLRG
uniref:DUF591 domain-containing protein n=1 Tax=Oryza sativa subsp. japonica TaxID=39947 RepID=Q53WL6_ORYSJ|nr:hypothetical protein [Oryza sativa Japonica Group]